MKIPWYSVFPFLFRTNGKRTTRWKLLPSLLWYFFRKYHSETTWSSHVQSFFLQELQDTLTTVFKTIHYSWRFHGHGSQYEVIFSSLNTLNKNWRMCLENQHLRNNPILLFEEYCTKTFRLLLHAPFFSQINLVYIFHIALFR